MTGEPAQSRDSGTRQASEASRDPAAGSPELTRLDPDATGPGPSAPGEVPPPPAGGARPFRWAIGIIGLALIVIVGVAGLTAHRRASTGVAPGQRLHWFAAARADTSLRGDANLHPSCRLATHDPRALNLCIDARRFPVVVAFFVTGSAACVRQVDALQALSRRYRTVRFLAVAVHATRAATLGLVRSHHWTIPVAEDPDGAVGEQYGVVVCPMAELAARGGVVRDRLIGDRWATAAALAPRVAALAR